MVDNLKAVQYSYCGIIYDKKIQSQASNSPMGDWYHFVLIRNNKIIAQCEEQGNYAGGIVSCSDKKSRARLKEWFDNLPFTTDEYDKSLYKKISHYKIGKPRDCQRTIEDIVCYECEKPNGNKVRVIRRLIGGCRPFHYFLQEINQDGKKLKIRNVPEEELLSSKLEVYPGRTVLIVPGV